MGMFDTIKCEYPLPDGFNDLNYASFQTKSLDCVMAEYVITKEGPLVEIRGPWFEGEKSEPVVLDDFHGEICFYTSNWSGSGFGYIMTSDDLPPWSREYVARFNKGQLIEIVGGLQECGNTSIHLPRDEWHKVTEAKREKHIEENYRTRHNKAMEYAEKAEALSLEGKLEEAKEQFSNAAYEEAGLAKQTHEEPERSQLFKSAIKFYLYAEEPEKALVEATDFFRYRKGWGFDESDEEVQKGKQEIVTLIKHICDLL